MLVSLTNGLQATSDSEVASIYVLTAMTQLIHLHALLPLDNFEAALRYQLVTLIHVNLDWTLVSDLSKSCMAHHVIGTSYFVRTLVQN